MYCVHCGKRLQATDTFCNACGQRRHAVDREAPSQDTVARPVGARAPVVPATQQPPIQESTAPSSVYARDMPRRSPALWIISGVAVIAGGWLYFSPYITLWKLRSAAASGDAAAIVRLVQWDALRSATKAEARTLLQAMVQRQATSADGQLTAALVGGVGSALSDSLIDYVVVPDNVAALLSGRTPDFTSLGFLGDAVVNGLQTALWNQNVSQADWTARVAQRLSYSTAYASAYTFELRLAVQLDGQPRVLPVARLLLTRSGLGWMVSGVRFSDELLSLVDTIEQAVTDERRRGEAAAAARRAAEAVEDERMQAASVARQRAADEEQQRVTAAEETARAAAADAEQIELERAKAAGAELRTMFGMIACDAAASRCHIGSSGAWFKQAETTGKRLLVSCPDGTACNVDGWVLPTQEVVVVDKAGPL